MLARPLNTPHVAPDVVHQLYPYLLWWAADLVANSQQKISVGSPANVKLRKVPAEQAPRVLEARQVLDPVSPAWAASSVLALHLASKLRDAMLVCSPQDFPAPPVCRRCVWRDELQSGTPLLPQNSPGCRWMMPSPLLQTARRPAQQRGP